MTPREKVIKIVRAMYDNGSKDSNEVYREASANRCAKVLIGEVLNLLIEIEMSQSQGIPIRPIIFWREVASEMKEI